MKITINIDDELVATLEDLANSQEITNEAVLENTVTYFLQSARKNNILEKVSTFQAEDLVAVEVVVNDKYEEVKARQADIEAQAEVEAMVEEIKSNISEDVPAEEVK